MNMLPSSGTKYNPLAFNMIYIKDYKLSKRSYLHILFVILYCWLVSSSMSYASEISNSKDISTKTLDTKTSLKQMESNSRTQSEYREYLKKDIKLIGTICTNDEKLNLAIIENNENKFQSVYSKDSLLPHGERIKGIFSDHILLEKEGENIILKISKGSGFDPNDLYSDGYQKLSSNEWIVNPNKLFKSVKEIARLCGELEINKEKEGFKIDEIGDNDFLKDLGLLEGDILTGVNGEKFDSLYDAINYIWNLKDDSKLSIEFMRNNSKNTLVFYPNYDQLPDYVKTGVINSKKITSMLQAKHKYTVIKVVYK